MENILNLKEDMKKIKNLGWIECNNKNYGAVGLKLEELLKINSDNFEIPDYNGIEIKTKKSIFEDKITLFCATPDSFLFEIARLHSLYSYPDSKEKEYNVLNTCITTKYKTRIKDNIYFKLKVDYENKKIILLVYENNKVIDYQTSWSFELLKEKLERKLKYLCFVLVDTKFSHNQLFVKYKNDRYYTLKDFNTFIKLIDKGIVSISMRIGVFKGKYRNGQIHDHGTSFSISKKYLEQLFNEI